MTHQSADVLELPPAGTMAFHPARIPYGCFQVAGQFQEFKLGFRKIDQFFANSLKALSRLFLFRTANRLQSHQILYPERDTAYPDASFANPDTHHGNHLLVHIYDIGKLLHI